MDIFTGFVIGVYVVGFVIAAFMNGMSEPKYKRSPFLWPYYLIKGN